MNKKLLQSWQEVGTNGVLPKPPGFSAPKGGHGYSKYFASWTMIVKSMPLITFRVEPFSYVVVVFMYEYTWSAQRSPTGSSKNVPHLIFLHISAQSQAHISRGIRDSLPQTKYI